VSSQELISKLESLGAEFDSEIAPLCDEQTIRAAQARFLGKKGRVSQLMREMGALAPEERKVVGAVFNRVKSAIADAVTRKLDSLEAAAEAAYLERRVDVTLPGRPHPVGHVHLLSQVWDEIVAIFAEIGFEVAEGPQVETDFNNFTALGIPPDHPARDDHDTFYVNDSVLLRTHTSPVQIRTMLAQKPPVKIVAPGMVYRRDDDPTHSPMFSQLEGLLVDDVVRFSDLKGVLLHYVRRFFGKALDLRFRPSYFPFVEPGAEVDMQCSFCDGGAPDCRICKGTGWVEICGAGMVDPVVFEHVGYDPDAYTGLAFGMGLERMAMLRHNVNDIKFYYEGDLRFLRQF
jgi:phenylalanyl-tRNA synthetase alpha chain